MVITMYYCNRYEETDKLEVTGEIGAWNMNIKEAIKIIQDEKLQDYNMNEERLAFKIWHIK